LRLPRDLFEPPTTGPYAFAESLLVHTRGNVIILEFISHDDEGTLWVEDEESEGWLPALLPLRADLARGDARALYLAWLAGIAAGAFGGEHDDEDLDEDGFDDEELDLEAVEPPVPSGLGHLSPALATLATFLRVDEDLLAAAAAASPELPAAPAPEDLQLWIATLPSAEKDALLLQLASNTARAQAGLLRRCQEATAPPAEAAAGKRTVAQLLTAAREHAAVRLHQQARQQAAAQARREREAAAARTRHLDSLAGQEEALWGQVAVLIEASRAKEYDQAMQLLADLRDLSARDHQEALFTARLGALRDQYPKRRGLHERLRRAGL